MTSPLRITRRAADRLRAGHLWIYRSDLDAAQDAEIPAGSLLTVVDNRSIPLGSALYSTSSQIAARLVSRTPNLTREQYLVQLRERIEAALRLRRELAPFNEKNTAHRLLFAEADGLPGIIADRYNDLIVLQLVTQGTARDDVRRILSQAFREELAPNGEPLTIWERPDPRIRELEQLPVSPSEPLFSNSSSQNLSSRPESPQSGDEVERPVVLAAPATTIFQLNGLRFHYDASAGQKTGAFLDQRLNYAAAARAIAASGRTQRASASGIRALDVCTYQGGFALHLAQVCQHVTGVDQSRSALEAAERNLALNPHLKAEVDWIEADAFALLRSLDDASRSPAAASSLPLHADPFDAIVLDPPAFAKSKRAMEGALRGYKELNLRAMKLLAPGGTLVTCSCSHHVSLADFTAVLASAAADANRRVQLLEIRAAAPDHPEVLTLPETQYLKCLICRVD